MRPKPKTLTPSKRFVYWLQVVGLRLLAMIVPLLSRAAVRRLGRVLGWLSFHLMREPRRVALANLDLAFGDDKSREQKIQIARVSLQNFACTVLGLFWSRRLTAENLRRFMEVDEEGLKNVRALKASGKSIIFITLHFGDWELLGLATGFFGIPVTVVQEAQRNEPIERVFAGLRGRSGHRIVRSRFAGTTLLKTLKRGGNIALLIDLNGAANRGGVWLEFFGRPVFNNAATAAMALRSAAAIVPSVAYPLPNGNARIVYSPEIVYRATGNYDEDLKTINQQCLRFCEEVVRHQPEHWMWSYKRWKFLPSPEATGFPYYAKFFPKTVVTGESENDEDA